MHNKIEKWIASGVMIVDPERTYIEDDTVIGVDTIILPGTHIRRCSQIGEHCIIGPDTWIDDSIIEDHVHIRYSVVESSRVRQGSSIGPYAHLRTGSDIGPDAKIGNFVEIKNSRIHAGVKVSHLAYIGDSEVGAETNIGAGAITCNYDGMKKHKTKIGKRVFVGSNVALVAPVEIGDDATIAAGSTITKDVPANNLAIARTHQINKPHWRRAKSTANDSNTPNTQPD
ncbi:hypothetical protein LM597_04665 [Candidatus Acetothermia bacterium]|nr:hypothetical protein [Candidatus Acetothermia bacterium]